MRHVLLLPHNFFPGAHFLYFWGLKDNKAKQSCQGFLQNWVIFYFKLGISQSWIIIYFCLQFWSNKAKHNFRNHDTQKRRAIDFNSIRRYRTSIRLFANIYPSSFILHRLTWAHQSPFLPEFLNDFNILNFRALVLINQRNSEEGCSKTRDTRCPVY